MPEIRGGDKRDARVKTKIAGWIFSAALCRIASITSLTSSCFTPKNKAIKAHRQGIIDDLQRAIRKSRSWAELQRI